MPGSTIGIGWVISLSGLRLHPVERQVFHSSGIQFKPGDLRLGVPPEPEEKITDPELVFGNVFHWVLRGGALVTHQL